MKHLFLVFLILLPLGTAAQTKLQHNIMLGTGVFDYGGKTFGASFGRGHLAMRLSYRLDVPLSDSWSIMPEVGAKFFAEGLFLMGAVGADFDGFTYLDLTVNGCYHTAGGLILGLGPMLSYTLHPDRYYVDADPSDPIAGEFKNKRFLLSLHPSILFDSGKRWIYGVDAEIGLNNAMIQYPQYTGKSSFTTTGNRQLNAVRFLICFHF